MTNQEIAAKQAQKQKNHELFKQYFNYGIVAITSLLVLMVAPALESAISGKLSYPTTTRGWIFWAVGRIAVTVINLVIFTALDKQSEINAKNNENYIAAKKLLSESKKEDKPALSPEQLRKQTYLKKVPFIILGSAASLVALSQIVFNYSLATLVSYIFTIVMDIAFAIWHMIDKEISYWCDEYYRYAKQEAAKAQNKPIEAKIIENNINTQSELKGGNLDANND